VNKVSFALCMAAIAAGASAQNLTSVNFDGYSIGALGGQGVPVWTDDSGSNAYQVDASPFVRGVHDVTVDTGPLGASTWAWQDLSGVSVTPGHTIIVSQTYAAVQTDPLDQVASYAGIDAYQGGPFARMAALRFRPTSGGTTGTVVMIVGTTASTSSLPAPAADAYHLLTLCLDTTTGKAAGFFNDQEVFITAPLTMSGWVPGSSQFTDCDLYSVPTGYNLLNYDDLRVDALVPGSIRGHVILEDFDGAVAGQAVTVEIRDAAGANVLDTKTGVLDAGGNFTVSTAIRGSVTVAVKGSHWLNQLHFAPINLTNFGIFGLSYQLINGDANDDNTNDIGDYALISASFNKSLGDPGYIAGADLSGDDSVDIGDYAILSANFGLSGD
jgi:hypothetical protein